MGKVVILGAGYAGAALARRLVARGAPVVCTTTTEARRPALAALGAEAAVLDLARPETWSAALGGAEAVVHLAPPAPGQSPLALARALRAAAGEALGAWVYGSTTAAFGHAEDPEAWVDEATPSGALSPRGQARLDWERALADAGLPLRVLRIAGIYGPGRTLRPALEAGSMVVFHGGPVTSRVHVDDLARLLEALLAPDAPDLAVACDERPAPTLEVARYTAELLGRPAPEPVSLEEARRRLSPTALEMRLGGHRCRSRVRPALIGALSHPTYREGVRASLAAEGALAP